MMLSITSFTQRSCFITLVVLYFFLSASLCADEKKVLDIGSRRELFVDNYHIDQLNEKATQRLQHPVRLCNIVSTVSGRVTTSSKNNGPLKQNEKVMAGFEKTILELENGGQMNCYFRKGTGPTLVLVPGTWGGIWRFETLIAKLPQKLEIAIVELCWQGRNKPSSLDMSMKQIADDVLKAVEMMKLKCFVVSGHSIGGMIAVEIAGRDVPGLVGAIPMEGWTHHTVVKTAFDGTVVSNLTPEEEAHRQMDRVRGRSHLNEKELQAIAAIWKQWDGFSCLERSTIPILQIWGDRGKPWPNRKALRIPEKDNIEIAWITNASHLVLVEDPAEVARLVLKFLKKNN